MAVETDMEAAPVDALRRWRRHLEIVWERLDPRAVIPSYAHEGDAGFDLVVVEAAVVMPGEAARLSIGLRAALPPGFWVWVTSRSSTWDRGFVVLDGKIDSGYRGEWFARLLNHTREPVHVEPGDRLVQGIVFSVLEAAMLEGRVDPDATTRGAGGFGSTGARS